jgi:hypothetical protein
VVRLWNIKMPADNACLTFVSTSIGLLLASDFDSLMIGQFLNPIGINRKSGICRHMRMMHFENGVARRVQPNDDEFPVGGATNATDLGHVGTSLRDGHRDFAAIRVSRRDTPT